MLLQEMFRAFLELTWRKYITDEPNTVTRHMHLITEKLRKNKKIHRKLKTQWSNNLRI